MMKKPEVIFIRLGQRIRDLREMQEITQDKLAEAVGLTRTSVVNIEQGRQRVMLDDIQKFAAQFGISGEKLMRGLW